MGEVDQRTRRQIARDAAAEARRVLPSESTIVKTVVRESHYGVLRTFDISLPRLRSVYGDLR